MKFAESHFITYYAVAESKTMHCWKKRQIDWWDNIERP